MCRIDMNFADNFALLSNDISVVGKIVDVAKRSTTKNATSGARSTL